MADFATETALDAEHEAFWRANFPRLHIGELLNEAFRDATLDAQSYDTAALDGERMRVDGYFQGRNDTAARLAPLLADAVTTCKALNLSPLFVFLFDEVWQCFYAMYQHLTPLLGNDYRVLPAFWVWHVDPAAEEAGWPPHRDKGRHALDADGNPLALTVWIPLSDATPLSSCMYLLPKSRDPVYGTEREDEWQIDFPAIRALPATTGDFFCWDQSVLHWGSTSSPYADGPRISMALEFQRSDIPAFVKPLIPVFANLDFKARLWLVARTIKEHRQANEAIYRVPALDAI